MTKTKKINKQVEFTLDQISNTLDLLNRNGLIRIIKNTRHFSNEDDDIVGWENHETGRFNCGNYFNDIEQYTRIYESGAFNAILFDGSIIRFNFIFRKNILIQQSMLFWPSPITIDEEVIDEFGIRNSLDMALCGKTAVDINLKMRSPFRYDYEMGNSSAIHPETHVHIQHSECRLSAQNPICFNAFISFILQNFFPDTETMVRITDRIKYSGFSVVEKSIINIQ